MILHDMDSRMCTDCCFLMHSESLMLVEALIETKEKKILFNWTTAQTCRMGVSHHGYRHEK